MNGCITVTRRALGVSNTKIAVCLAALLVVAAMSTHGARAASSETEQGATGTATTNRATQERGAPPGLAPPMPYVGGARGGASCDASGLEYHPQCREWLKAYEDWRKAYDAYHRG